MLRWHKAHLISVSSAIAVVVAATVTTLLAGSGPAAADDGPPLSASPTEMAAALHCPAAFTHPSREPVLLVHGTGMNFEEAWGWGFEDGLSAAGYDVCGVDLPGYSLIDIQDSAEYVVHAIRAINAATGRKVDVVGHSQGNIQIRWAVKWWTDLQTKVDDVVFLASPSHGGLITNVQCVLPCSAPATQLQIGSNLLAALNGGDETPGPISYTSIYTYNDELVVPATSAMHDGARNIAIQDVCFGRTVLHGGLLYDAVAYRLVEDALSHAGTANPGRLPFGKCLEGWAPGVSAGDVAAFNTFTAVTVVARFALAPLVWSEPPLRSYAV